MQHYTNLKLRSHTQLLGPISLVCLLSLLFIIFCPIINTNTSALTLSPSELQTNIPSRGSLAIALNQDTTLDITPQTNGTFQAATNHLTIHSTHPTGYTLYLNTNDHTNSLINTNSANSSQITATNPDTLGTNLAHNTWGFHLTENQNNTSYQQFSYQPVPLTANQVAKTSLAASTDQYNLILAANIDTSLPAGQYTNNLVVSAIANPIYITGLLDLVYMQDMTSSVCSNTVAYDGTDITGQPGSEVSKQLIDTRDGKAYWVSKLADGNCWMTQNLALDLKTSQTLTNVDTDLNSKNTWTPASTIISETLTFPKGIDRATSYSWNLGEYVLTTPTRGVSCNSAPTTNSTNTDPFNSVRIGRTIEQNCSDFINVAKNNWRPTFDSSNAPEGTWTGTNYNSSTGTMEPYTYTGPLSINKETKEYDAHYLIGNYYQWNAATADSGKDLVSTGAEQDPNKLKDAPDSICPKGWSLPTTGRNTVTGIPFDRKNSFYRLLLAYDYPENTTTTNDSAALGAWYTNEDNTYTQILNGILGSGNKIAHQNPALEPIYLTRGGMINTWTASYRAASLSSYLWPSTISPSAPNLYETYGFQFAETTIFPSDLTNQIYGFPIRCLAR